jgi:3'-phosphoadenosine 5'-phosphosulfate sulfotransferase (PAPS reductase)/FAD synthetase
MDNHVSTPSPFRDGHNNQLPLFSAAWLNEQAEIAVTEQVRDLLESGTPVALCVSGGKDSSAVAIRTSEYLDSIGHRGPRILVHSDLGRIEWRQSLPVCERLAKYLGLDLVVVRRRKGDLLDRLWQRWQGNVQRYAELSCVKLILPWPTAAMRFCTSELKTAVICRELVRRYPNSSIVSVCGIRREESSNRAKAAVVELQPKLCSTRLQTRGVDWRPILDWSRRQVFEFLSRKGFDLHEAYTRYGSSRVSCAFCILGSKADLLASSGCEANAAVYRELVRLETHSTFAFQRTRWLSDVAPHLLSPEEREAAQTAKHRARLREDAEARIPKRLVLKKGRPTCVPSFAEAELLAEVRTTVASIVGLTIGFTDAEAIRARYADLYQVALAP